MTLTVDEGNPKYGSENNTVYTKDTNHLVLGARGLTKLIIPERVVSIGGASFGGSIALTQVETPENAALTIIGDKAFIDCSALKTVHIGNKVKSIESTAFGGCTNAEITLPESITTINSGAFGLDTSSYCKKVRIKSGTHYNRIEKLVKDSGYTGTIEKY